MEKFIIGQANEGGFFVKIVFIQARSEIMNAILFCGTLIKCLEFIKSKLTTVDEDIRNAK